MFIFIVAIISFLVGISVAFAAFVIFTKSEQPHYLECANEDIPSSQKLSSTIPTTSIHDTNKAANAVNSLLQFLFQELKDTGKVRRYFIRKIKIELDELTRRKVLSSIIRNIEILDFDMGQSSPEFNTLALRDCKYDGTGLLEDVQLYTHIAYKHGFSLSISVETLLEKSGVFTFKLNKFESDAYFVLSREPFTHWYLSFARDPYIEMKVSTHVGARNIPQLANLIAYQLKKAILRKHVWPSYKVRFRPFFNAPPSLDIDDEVTGAPTGKPMYKACLNCVPFEMVVVDLRRIERLANTFADMLTEPQFKYPQQLIIGTMLSETSVYDEISSRKLFDERYPCVKRIQLPRGLHDCFKLAEISVFRRGFVFVTRTQRAIEQLLNVGDTILQMNGHSVQTIEAFNSIYNDKQSRETVSVLVRKTKIQTQPVNFKERHEKAKSCSDLSFSEIEEAVRQSLLSVENWFPPEQLARMNYSQTKLPAKYVNINEYFNVKPKNTDAYCNVILLSMKEMHQPAILAYCCFTLEEIICDCDLTQKRSCKFSRSLFPANFDAADCGLGNATLPFGFAHSMAFGHIVVTFRLIENADTFLMQEQDKRLSDVQISKQESVTCVTEDEIFFVHQLHPFRVESASSCKICHGKIWMKNALRCQLCGVVCHQKCASACYAQRCPGYNSFWGPLVLLILIFISLLLLTVLWPNPRLPIAETLFRFPQEARILLEDNEDLISQTMISAQKLSSISSETGDKDNLICKAKDLAKTISKEFAPYIKGLGPPSFDSAEDLYAQRFTGISMLDNTISHIKGHARDKLKSLATLYLVHLHAIDNLCTDHEIVRSIIDDIADRVCRIEMLGRADQLTSRADERPEGVGGKIRFLQNVGRFVNRGGSYVVSRYRDKMMSKVFANANGSHNNNSGGGTQNGDLPTTMLAISQLISSKMQFLILIQKYILSQ